MSAPMDLSQIKFKIVNQEPLIFKEEGDITNTKAAGKLNREQQHPVNGKFPAKLLVGLALGALIIAATALPIGVSADVPSRPLSGAELEMFLDDDGFEDVYDVVALGKFTRPLSGAEPEMFLDDDGFEDVYDVVALGKFTRPLSGAELEMFLDDDGFEDVYDMVALGKFTRPLFGTELAMFLDDDGFEEANDAAIRETPIHPPSNVELATYDVVALGKFTRPLSGAELEMFLDDDGFEDEI